MTKRKKARAGVEAAAAVAAAAPTAVPGFSRIVAPADRSTTPDVGLLPEAAQLGCLPGPETAQLARSSGWKQKPSGQSCRVDPSV